jgi:hypothetical protein
VPRPERGQTPAGFRAQLLQRIRNVVFHVDLSSGDALVDPAEVLRGSDLLAFAGVPPVDFPVYPITQHLAEKLHAYTLPRAEGNTRVKDLLDMVFVASVTDVDGDQLLRSVRATFAARATHQLLTHLPSPPDTWRGPFAALANEMPNAPTNDLADAYRLGASFWDPVLGGRAAGLRWSCERQTWGGPSGAAPS